MNRNPQAEEHKFRSGIMDEIVDLESGDKLKIIPVKYTLNRQNLVYMLDVVCTNKRFQHLKHHFLGIVSGNYGSSWKKVVT